MIFLSFDIYAFSFMNLRMYATLIMFLILVMIVCVIFCNSEWNCNCFFNCMPDVLDLLVEKPMDCCL